MAETACGITTQLTGEVLPVAKDMETRSYREPLGVVAAICPFSKSSNCSPRWKNSDLGDRLPSHDSPMVDPYRHSHWQLSDH